MPKSVKSSKSGKGHRKPLRPGDEEENYSATPPSNELAQMMPAASRQNSFNAPPREADRRSETPRPGPERTNSNMLKRYTSTFTEAHLEGLPMQFSALGRLSENEHLPEDKEGGVGLDAATELNHFLTKQLNDVRERARGLQEERDAHTQRISELQLRLISEMDRNSRIKELANQMQYTIESKELFVGPQSSDDEILSDFRSILDEVRTWSIKFACESPISLDNLPVSVVTAFQRLAPACPDLRRLLSNRKHRRLFVRGWVSLGLADWLFRCLPSDHHSGSRCEDGWLDTETAHGVFLVERMLVNADRRTVSHRDLNDWRALTTTLLSRLDSPSSTTEAVQAYIKSCSRYILTPIAGWTVETNQQKLEDELLGILSGTLKLSQKLRCQRACWSVRHLGAAPRVSLPPQQPGPFMVLDARAMRDINGDEYDDVPGRRDTLGRIVDLVIGPGLYKRGNTNGQGFDTETCMERSEVKCRESWSEGHRDVKLAKSASLFNICNLFNLFSIFSLLHLRSGWSAGVHLRDLMTTGLTDLTDIALKDRTGIARKDLTEDVVFPT
ncbi:hypothetical protein LPUS_04304 [Lasallia pustulata]|uniref:Uncharacterized protein n=1 Tax=Lasallia pustulata TaxID=136370 RepID=A0A1W5CWQ6_9LECA|nr:hypothetical protein LPUS_04304 [Lasallia pustulata]